MPRCLGLGFNSQLLSEETNVLSSLSQTAISRAASGDLTTHDIQAYAHEAKGGYQCLAISPMIYSIRIYYVLHCLRRTHLPPIIVRLLFLPPARLDTVSESIS